MDWVDEWAGKRKAKPSCFKQTFHPPENKFKLDYILEAADLRIAILESPMDKPSLYNTNNRRRRPITYSLAKIVETEGPRLRIRHLGTDDRNDLWLMADSDLLRPYPSGKELTVPFGFMSSHSVWSKMISKVDEEELIAPSCWFPQHPKDPGSNQFKVGEKLEAVDRRNAQLICPATIGDVRDNYIMVKFDGWSGNFDYWTTYNSQDLFPVGWCSRANYKLQYPGPGYVPIRLKSEKAIISNNNVVISSPKRGSYPSRTACKRKMKTKSKVKPKDSLVSRCKQQKECVKNEIDEGVNESDRRKKSSLSSVNNALTVNVKIAGGNNKVSGTAKSGISSPDSESTQMCIFDGDENNLGLSGVMRNRVTANNGKHKWPINKLVTERYNMKSAPIDAVVEYDENVSGFSYKADAKCNIMKEGESAYPHSHSTESSLIASLQRNYRSDSNFSSYSTKASRELENIKDYSDPLQECQRSYSSSRSRSSSSSSSKSRKSDTTSPNTNDPHRELLLGSDSTSAAEPPSLSSQPFVPHTTSPPHSLMNSSNANSVIEEYKTLLSSDTNNIPICAPLNIQPPQTPISSSFDRTYNLPSNPSEWSVNEVISYIVKKNPSLACILPDFKNHEIDGQALLLLNMNTLRQYMKIKLGPAIKIENIIKNLQEGKL